MAAVAHIIILRFSAMGDVALLAPVLKSAVEQNPDKRFTLVTKSNFKALFDSLSPLNVFPADFDAEFKGIIGLWRLASEIQAMKPSVVVDAHDHLRTKFLRFLLWMYNIKVVVFDKGRKEKNAFIKAKDKKNIQTLTHTCERYRLAFLQAGISISITAEPPFARQSVSEKFPPFLELVQNKRLIGVAPFAAHFTKIWPLENFIHVMQSFIDEKEIVFLLFGGGKSEQEKLESIANKYTNCINVAGKLSISEEILLMSQLELMICVDSSNMHLAALSGIPVLSIWGGTHTGTGFGPFPNPGNRIIEIPVEDLSCRPCSVYGLSACPRKDHACMQRIKPYTVTGSLKEMLRI